MSDDPAIVETPLSVLIVDDDEAMCRSLRRVLRLDGYAVETAGSVAEMLARPDLSSFFAVLLDRRLPDGDASETIQQIREIATTAAILIITGHADMDSTLAAIRQGVDDYLIKPVEPDTLRARLTSLAELFRIRESLRESEARMRFLVEHLPAGAVYVDREKLFMNRATVEMTGFAAEEIGTVNDWFTVLCHERADLCRKKYKKVKQDGFQHPCRLPITRHDGVAREIEIAGYRYDHHEIWLVTDITKLRDTQLKLVQAERLAAIGQMVTGLAHESRNALQRARGCLDLLELDLEGNVEQLDLIQRTRRSLGDLQRNYEEVRNYAAPIVLKKVDSDVGSLIKQAFNDLKDEYGGCAHQLHMEIEPESNQNRLDTHRMNQVFRNIIENALAASPEGSTIRVRISLQEIAGKVGGKSTNTALNQCIEVIDEGCGLSPETFTRIFEPFYTTKQSGTGLGMAICKRIVDAHEGTIGATNVDGGTSVCVNLPVKRAK